MGLWFAGLGRFDLELVVLFGCGVCLWWWFGWVVVWCSFCAVVMAVAGIVVGLVWLGRFLGFGWMVDLLGLWL